MANFMRKYLGLEPPPPKKTKTREETLQRQQQYDKNKRERSFQPKWHSGRPWLQYTPPDSNLVCKTFAESAALQPSQFKGGTMKCCDCLHAGEISSDLLSNNTFGTGCLSLKLESVKFHEDSLNHKKAQKIMKAKLNPVDTPAFKIVASLNKENLEKLDRMFRNCHAIASNNRPYRDFLWLCKLDEAKGIFIGETYRNVESAKTFTSAIAHVERQKTLNMLTEAKFLAILSDGTTDASTSEQEMFYMRASINGKIKVVFVAIIHVEKANAESILNGMQKAVEVYLQMSWDKFISSLCSLGCDGASVMMGKNAGLYALLKLKQPSVIAVHCFAHRIELAFKDSIKKLKLYEKTVETLLMGLYYFYYKSALNKSMLKRSFKALDMKILIPTRVGGTRWIGHVVRAITNVTRGYKAFVQHLQQITDTDICQNRISRDKGKCFLKLLTSRDIVMFMHFLLDVCEPLKKLSLTCQEQTSTIADIHRGLKSAVAVIRQYKTSDGPNLRAVENTYQELRGDSRSFLSARKKLVDDLETSLSSRFVDKHYEDVLLATKILNFRNWPTSFDADGQAFGCKEVQTVTDHYMALLTSAEVELNSVEPEWTSLKSILYDECPDLQITWQDIWRKYQQGHNNILTVIDLLQTIPGSSSEVERGFSQLKLLKTDTRSTLSEYHLNDFMTIKMISDPVDTYNPYNAITYWNSSGSSIRRPSLKDSVKIKSKDIDMHISVGPASETGNVVLQPELSEPGPSTSGHAMPDSDNSDYVNPQIPVENVENVANSDYNDDSDCDSGLESDYSCIDESHVDKLLLDYM